MAAENVSMFQALFKEIASTRSWSIRGAFSQSAFMGSCLTVSRTSLTCLPSRQVGPRVPGVIEGGEDAAWV